MIDATPHKLWSNWTGPSLWIVVVCSFFVSGCATVPYKYGHFRSPDAETPPEIEFDYGKPQKTLDNIAWATGIWSRLLFLNSGINKHELSEKTKQKLIAYLEENELEDVLIRVNQYDPKGEWHRLRANRRIAAGYRYTIGLVWLAQYSLIPGRIFGGDEYNPYTNSLYVNSDLPSVVLHEAAYAKDIHGRRLPGTYAFINEIPLISLWRRTNCVNDVLGYARTNDDWDMEHETYRVVYPQMGVHSTALAGAFVPFWDGMILTVAGAAAGHATGRIAIYNRSRVRSVFENELESEGLFESEEMQAIYPSEDVSENNIQVTKHEEESPDDE